MHKTQVQVGQGPQHKTGYTKSHRRESGNSLDLIGTEVSFLNRNTNGSDTKISSNKWDLMKLRNFCKAMGVES